MGENTAWVLFQRPNEKLQYLLRSGTGDSEFSMTSFQGNHNVKINGSAELIGNHGPDLSWFSDAGFSESTSESDHFKGVNSSVEQIRKGQIQKIVLSKVARVDHSEIAVFDLFKSLCASYPKAFNYVCFHPESGVWSGATPELLLQRENYSYTTVALAGTRIQDGISEWTEKEYQEQRIVKDYIVDELAKTGIEEIEVGELMEAQNGHLVHLKNVLKFNFSGPTDQLLTTLHPTPAVCGTPKNEALRIIDEIELHDRKYYSGYLGLKMKKDEESFFVNLRCMEVKKEMSLLYAGGGITSSSDPKKEWIELLNKTKILKDVILGLQNQAHV